MNTDSTDKPKRELTALGGLAKTYQDLQKIRIGLGNRTWAAENGKSDAVPKVYEQMTEQLKEMEDSLVKSAKAELKEHPAWPWMQKVKGLGPTMAMQLIGYIGDIGRFDTVSKLWKYSGLAVTDGQADRRRRGQVANYSPKFKVLMYNIGTSFLRSGSPYRRIYDETKARYQYSKQDALIVIALIDDQVNPGKNPWKTIFKIIPALEAIQGDNPGAYLQVVIKKAREEKEAWKALLEGATKAAKDRGLEEPWTDQRIHLTSLRKMEKITLAHLWEVWRLAEGLPIRKEYVFDQLGHTSRYTPEEFVA